MNMRTSFLSTIAVCAVGAVLVFAPSAYALQLITKSEAALPVDSAGHRGISRGPTIVVVSPSPVAGTIQSPLELKIKFESHGSAVVNVDSVLVTYVKAPAVDLTARIKPFIAASGINVKDADVPPGTHTVRVNVTDSYGHESSADFTFIVAQ
jgi:hypothetical protein